MQPLTGEDLMHAVARARPITVRRGMAKAFASAAASPRSYYVGIESAMPAVPGFAAPLKASPWRSSAWRKEPRHRIPDREFGLIVDEPAEFRFFCSASRKNDPPGALIEDFGDDLEELSPVEVRLTSDGASPELMPVSFETVITETGMLQLWCVARDGRRWKLEFNVRERMTALNPDSASACPCFKMKVGNIDLGTTNSALAWIDPPRPKTPAFPPSTSSISRNSSRQDASSPGELSPPSCTSTKVSP